MSRIDQWLPLKTPTEVDAFLAANPRCLIFKWSTCYKTEVVLERIGDLVAARPDVPVGLIRVVDWRPASNHVAALTGFRHESPQVLLFDHGEAVFERNNWEVTETAVRDALANLEPAVEPARQL